MGIKQLDNGQLKDFDWEFVGEDKKALIAELIRKDFPQGEFHFVDIGGGNGVFADWLLETFPDCRGVVVDNSEMLLLKNAENPRKRVLLGCATRLVELLDQEPDVIFFNYVLHHLVGDSYWETRRNQIGVLTDAARILAPSGRVWILENIYDGLVIKGLPSYAIYFLTSFKAIAKIVRKLGANTAGVGVCFLGRRQWQLSMAASGLVPTAYHDHRTFRIGIVKRLLLHLGHVRGGSFWCKVA